MARGVFPANNPYDVGMPGMHGTVEANYTIQHCDCLIAVGMRFDDRVTSNVSSFAPNAKTIVQVVLIRLKSAKRSTLISHW